MKAIVTAVLLACAAAAFAQKPPPEYLQRVTERYRAAFAAADAGAEGYVTRSDLTGNLFLLPVFDAMDANRDGRVTRAELDRFLAELPPGAA